MTGILISFMVGLSFVAIGICIDNFFITVHVKPGIYMAQDKKVKHIKKRHVVVVRRDKLKTTMIEGVTVARILKIQNKKRNRI